MRTNRLAAVVAALLLAGPMAVSAQVSLSGFGQIVVGNDFDDGAYPALGYDDDLGFDRESLFAVQVSGNLNDQWSATAQVVARGSDDWDPEFSWAYVAYNSGGLSLKLGKQRTPLYRYSDFLEVGYAYQWLRPPQSVYNLPFNEYNGANLGYSWYVGDWSHRVQGIVGRLEEDFLLQGSETEGEIASLYGFTVESSYNDWLSLRASYFTGDSTFDSPALNPLLRALTAAGLGAAADAIAVDDDKGTFFGIGFEIDRNNMLFGGEYVEAETRDSLISERSEYYLFTGYRFGTVTPTLTYGRRDNDPSLDALALIPAQAPVFATVAGLLRSDASDDTYTSVGVRWDFARNLAFKADYTDFSSDLAFREDAALLSAGVVFTF